MDFKKQILEKIAAVEAEKLKTETELKKLEEDFANVKLNPYGITAIDFSKRQELSCDVLKMEGCLMGLTLAVDTYDEIDRS
jgi:hypothetical protein